jgi:hypothetical protein
MQILVTRRALEAARALPKGAGSDGFPESQPKCLTALTADADTGWVIGTVTLLRNLLRIRNTAARHSAYEPGASLQRSRVWHVLRAY